MGARQQNLSLLLELCWSELPEAVQGVPGSCTAPHQAVTASCSLPFGGKVWLMLWLTFGNEMGKKKQNKTNVI